MSTGGPLLKVEDISKVFGGLRAVDHIDMEVREGETVGLIGPNGAGKTTLFNLISGFARPSEGIIRWDGEDVTPLRPAQRAALGLVRTFQNARVFMRLSIQENLALGAHRFGRETDRAEIREALHRLGLERIAGEAAGVLSYGQAKRLGLAIALLCKPALLLLDEPAAGLNTDEVGALGSDFADMRSRGITIVLVEHHMGLVMKSCERIVVLDAGRKIAEGVPEEVAKDKAVIGAYLGA